MQLFLLRYAAAAKKQCRKRQKRKKEIGISIINKTVKSTKTIIKIIDNDYKNTVSKATI